MQSSQIPIPSKFPTTCGKSPRCGAPRRFCPPTYLNHMEVISTIKHKRCVGIEWYSILSWYIIHLLYHVTYTYTWYQHGIHDLRTQIFQIIWPIRFLLLWHLCAWQSYMMCIEMPTIQFVLCSIASVLDGTNFIWSRLEEARHHPELEFSLTPRH